MNVGGYGRKDSTPKTQLGASARDTDANRKAITVNAYWFHFPFSYKTLRHGERFPLILSGEQMEIISQDM